MREIVATSFYSLTGSIRYYRLNLMPKVGYWLEIKRVAQFLESGPNWHYERTLLETLTKDVFKLASDPTIFYASLLVVLFTSNASIGNRDLHVWKRHAMSHGCPVGIPRILDFSITNRIGNEHV